MSKPSVRVWLTKEDHELVTRWAKESGQSLSSFGYDRIFNQNSRPGLTSNDRQAVDDLLLVLGDLLVSVNRLEESDEALEVLDSLNAALSDLNRLLR